LFYEGPDPKQQLLDYLRGKSLLLMLDNFEHLLDGVDLITELLSAAPRVKVVVTSREALNLHGEWFHPIDGLSYPLVNAQDRREGALALEEYEAVALFTQCARRARPGVCLEQELDDVARICQLVEGMPLAIELAASWLKVLPARKIAEELERGLDILSTTMRDLPRRHRSMRAAFDHSWRLLAQEEREVLRRLSVFRGGCRRRAAQAVAGAALPALAALVDKSLLTATREGRYQVHELLRQYAAEKLLEGPAEWETAHSQHSAYFAAFVEERGEALKGAGQQDALAELRAEIENVRAAWDWAVERGQFPLLDQALEGLCRFYEWRGRFQEGQMSCRAAAEKLTSFATSADELGILARTWIWCSFFDLELGKSESAGNLIRQSLDLLDRPEFADRDTRRERAVALCEMGRVAHNLGERGEARKHCEQSLALFRSVDLCWEAARVLERLGDITYSMSLYREAERCYEESLAIRQSLGDRRGMADSLFGLSITAAHTGQSEQAEHFVGRAIAIQRELGNEVDLTHGLFHLGNRYTALGRFTEACPLLEEAAEMYAEMGMRTYLAIAWDMLAWAKTNLGLYEDGSALLRKSHTEFRELGDLHGTGYSHLSHGDIAVARGAYAEAERHYRKCLAIFQKVEQRDEQGLAHAGLALAARGQNDIIRAHKRTFEALKIAVETGAYGASLFAVSNAALLYADAGEIERAVELCALVKSHAYFGASRLRQDMTGKHIDAAAAELTPEVIATAQERGHARDLWDTAAELLEELALKLGL
jgi:predicted ATPase